MTQLLLASTMYQCISLAAAADADLTGSEPGEERILLLANSAQVPELTGPLQDAPGFDRIAARFDRVLDLGELIYPRRPPQFAPHHEELRMWETLLRSYWQLGSEPVRLVLDSVHVNPGIALARIFGDAPLLVHSDGLMVYGPTRTALDLNISQRLAGLLYLDLVPGLRPQLLREYAPAATALERARLRAVIAELTEIQGPLVDREVAEHQSSSPGSAAANGGTALVLGQYLTELQLISRAEEADLHRRMLTVAAEQGIGRCIFKPHPSASSSSIASVQAAGAELGLDLMVLAAPVPAEVVMDRLKPQAVIGAFSTALATARYVFDIETFTVGTELLLERLTPFQNSNRIPVTIVDALLVRGLTAPADGPGGDNALQELVEAVAYCMQPTSLTELREQARRYLTRAGADQVRYFKRRRLAALDLPGALPVPWPAEVRWLHALWSRLPHPARRMSRRLLKTVTQ